MFLGSVLALAGCAGSADFGVEVEEDLSPRPSASESGEVEFNGTTFVPLDSLSESERAELEDPDMFALPNTVERTAQRMRWHMVLDNVHYVEATPNMELARLALEELAEDVSLVGLPGPSQREGRAINGTDNRSFAVGPNTWPRESIAMSESSGSGTIMGTNRRIYTAAHVVYQNIPTWEESLTPTAICRGPQRGCLGTQADRTAPTPATAVARSARVERGNCPRAASPLAGANSWPAKPGRSLSVTARPPDRSSPRTWTTFRA